MTKSGSLGKWGINKKYEFARNSGEGKWFETHEPMREEGIYITLLERLDFAPRVPS